MLLARLTSARVKRSVDLGHNGAIRRYALWSGDNETIESE